VKVTAERSNDNSCIVPCPGGDSKPAPVKDSDTWCVSLQTRRPDIVDRWAIPFPLWCSPPHCAGFFRYPEL